MLVSEKPEGINNELFPPQVVIISSCIVYNVQL